MSTKFTPGPWEYDGADVAARGVGIVCTAYISDHDGHLIAAAPDLYAALHDLISANKFTGSKPLSALGEARLDIAMDRANAALAKARGEP